MAGYLLYTTDGWTGTSSSLSVDMGTLTLAGQTALVIQDGDTVVSWVAPTQTEDDASLGDDLLGFHVWYGQDRANLSNLVTVSDPDATSVAISGLTSGTWYFEVDAYSVNGSSARTETLSKVIA